MKKKLILLSLFLLLSEVNCSDDGSITYRLNSQHSVNDSFHYSHISDTDFSSISIGNQEKFNQQVHHEFKRLIRDLNEKERHRLNAKEVALRLLLNFKDDEISKLQEKIKNDKQIIKSSRIVIDGLIKEKNEINNKSKDAIDGLICGLSAALTGGAIIYLELDKTKSEIDKTKSEIDKTKSEIDHSKLKLKNVMDLLNGGKLMVTEEKINYVLNLYKNKYVGAYETHIVNNG